MNDNFKSFKRGFIEGAKETPRGFFAPIFALFRWMDRVTDEGMNGKENQSLAVPAQLDGESPSRSGDASQRYQLAASAITQAGQALEDARRAAFETLEVQDPKLAALATDVLAGRDHAICWLLDEPLSAFRGSTAWDLVLKGKAEAVMIYLESISSGFVG
jgi:hypothetical protein